ncbi:MAG: anhydro-N-acetylmuramic acid kinase [Pseudomonadota bacterium]|nr:anhydro-N-acetylmuramic acid kinase [Pseudomonadota bacterium]
MSTDVQRCIGLMSGTSSDAIDAVLLEISEDGRRAELIDTHSQPIDPELRERIRAVSQGENDRIDTVQALDVELAEHFSNAAAHLLANADGLQRTTIIGSHGQTVRHRPEDKFPFSLQLGNGALIAARTGITTVTDFRSGDIALGGQGAPLAGAFHRAMFYSQHNNRAIVNIGGIANVTVLTAAGPIIGFDTGPGNTLLDHWYRCHNNESFDRNSEWAAQGTPINHLGHALQQHPYFMTAPPKSCGLETFNLKWLETYLDGTESAPDVQATLLDLTVHTITAAVQDHGGSTAELYLCGGGARNPAMVTAIAHHLVGMKVDTTAALGVAPEWVEAAAFAWMAWARLMGQPTNLTEVTGAERRLSLGAVYNP